MEVTSLRWGRKNTEALLATRPEGFGLVIASDIMYNIDVVDELLSTLVVLCRGWPGGGTNRALGAGSPGCGCFVCGGLTRRGARWG